MLGFGDLPIVVPGFASAIRARSPAHWMWSRGPGTTLPSAATICGQVGASPEGIVDLDGVPGIAGQMLAEGQQLQALKDGQRLGCGASLTAAALWSRPGGRFRAQVLAREQLMSHQRLGARHDRRLAGK